MTIHGGTWTYANPRSSTKDHVRFLIGDTDTTNQRLADEEIQFLIDEYGSVHRAAAMACRIIAAGMNTKGSKSVGDMSISGGAEYDGWLELAKALEEQGSEIENAPQAIGGGIDKSRKRTVSTDALLVPPDMVKHQFDDPIGDC